MKGQFIKRNGKLHKEQAILKSHLIKHKKHLRNLCLHHDDISNIIKSSCGPTFLKLSIINIISVLQKENKVQLRCKNLKTFKLIPKEKDS